MRKLFILSVKSNFLELEKYKSLINNMNSEGAKSDPCGTPDNILKESE